MPSVSTDKAYHIFGGIALKIFFEKMLLYYYDFVLKYISKIMSKEVMRYDKN